MVAERLTRLCTENAPHYGTNARYVYERFRMISLLLAQKIIELFIILLAGYVATRAGLLHTEDARGLSTVTLFLVTPASFLTAFEVDLTSELTRSLALVFVVALVANLMMYALGTGFARLTGASVVERASVTYSNAGNLILPIVLSVLGERYVIYATGYMVVQNLMFWTLMDKMYSVEAHISLRKVLTNVNIIAVLLGFVLLATGVRLPSLLDSAVHSLGAMIGPASMLIVGITLAGLDLSELRRHRLAPLVVLAKMVIIPLIMILLFKLSGVASLIADGEKILMVPMLAVMSCTATTVTQFAQLYGKEPEYASALSVMTTLACVVTMPLMVQLYLL